MSISVLRNDTISAESLGKIFNPENKIACANYGGGTHCNEVSIGRKLNIWGRNSEGKDENSCMAAKIFYVNSEPAGLFNIGKTGNPATAIDRTGAKEGSVYEFSGLFVRDQFLDNGLVEISQVVKGFMHSCTTDENFTKAIVTFAIDHPYQKEFLSTAGGLELTQENIEKALGANSLHPERFKFEEGQFKECSKWDREAIEVKHDGWHNSAPCTEWASKTIMLFGINEDGNIAPSYDEL